MNLIIDELERNSILYKIRNIVDYDKFNFININKKHINLDNVFNLLSAGVEWEIIKDSILTHNINDNLYVDIALSVSEISNDISYDLSTELNFIKNKDLIKRIEDNINNRIKN